MNIVLTRNVNNPFRVTIVAERMNVCKLSSCVLRRAVRDTYNRNDKSGKPREIMLSSDKQGAFSLALAHVARVRLILALPRYISYALYQTVYIHQIFLLASFRLGCTADGIDSASLSGNISSIPSTSPPLFTCFRLHVRQ